MLAAWLGPEPALGGKEFYMYHQYSFSEMPVMMINRSVQGAKGDFFLLLGLAGDSAGLGGSRLY